MIQAISQIPAMNKFRQHVLVCLLLSAATLVVYWNVGEYEFINFDDNMYVYNNKHVQKGLTPDSLLWSFSLSKDTTIQAYWHPLTWISHMIDYELFGLNAGNHHRVNLAFHIINTILLFFVFHQMTGTIGRSAFLAALFAVHPLNVDSVAWIAERKNLLSTSFWLLTMIAYVHYTRKPSLFRYLLVFFGMLAGLLSKPMLVTLPCVLLLLDFWPLGRLRLTRMEKETGPDVPHSASLSFLIVEKFPLLLLSCLSIISSVISLQNNNQLVPQQVASMPLRIENAIVSYIKYVIKIIWPGDMTIYYPFPETIPLWQVSGAIILIAAVFAAIIILKTKAPYMVVGWLWFAGTLLPVIGIIQGGLWPEMADRWTYVPAIGIFIIIIWGGAAVFKKNSIPPSIAVTTALSLLILLIVVSRNQVSYWRDSVSLFTHALTINQQNAIAHYNLGEALAKKGQADQAISHYLASIQINPKLSNPHNNLGIALAEKGKIDDAIYQFRQTLQLDPDMIEAHINIGKAYAEKGFWDDAKTHFEIALKIDPEDPEARVDMGKVLAHQKSFDQAIAHFHHALEIDPLSVSALNGLGNAFAEKGMLDQAIGAYEHALKIDPAYVEVHNNMGNALIRKGRLDEALYHYETIISKNQKNSITIQNRNSLLSLLKPADQINILFKTAIRFAEEKKYDRAIDLFQRVLEINPDNPLIYYNISCLYALRNQRDQAVYWLLQSVDHGYSNWEKLKTDPDMNNIKDEPVYRKLLEKGRELKNR